MTDTLNAQVAVRVPRKFKRDFLEKCRRYGSVSHISRELLEAFVDGRLRIIPNPERPMLERFYNDHRN